MIRVWIAAMLLRSAGGAVNFVVRRRSGAAKKHGLGTTLGTFRKLRDARKKFNAARVADTDTITINVEAIVAQRHGDVFGTNTPEPKENDNG